MKDRTTDRVNAVIVRLDKDNGEKENSRTTLHGEAEVANRERAVIGRLANVNREKANYSNILSFYSGEADTILQVFCWMDHTASLSIRRVGNEADGK